MLLTRIRKKKISLFVLATFLVVPLVFSGSSGGSGSDEPDDKKLKHSCYFGSFRYGNGERISRVRGTAVSIRCGGELKQFSALNEHGPTDLYGSFSGMDLTLTRGGAIFMKDISEEENWKDVFICSNHIDELLLHWHSVSRNHINYIHGSEILCSWPFIKHDKHLGKKFHYVQREEARLYLLATGKHLHIGTPICFEHYREAMREIHEFIEKSNDPDFLEQCSASETAECSQEELIERKFFEFASLVGINRPVKEFSSYKRDTQRKKADGVMTVQRWATHFMAPRHESELKAAVNARCSRGQTSEAEATINGVMEVIADEFLLARSHRLRDYVLSLVAGRYPHHVIARYIPSLSLSKYHRARVVALSGALYPPEIKRTVDRIDEEGVNQFIGFITSPIVMVDIPSGTRKVKLSSGEVVEIPNTIRLLNHAEIIRQFGHYMRAQEMEDHLLSASSLHRILRALPADEKHALTCVDKNKSRAFYAFEDLLVILKRLLELAIIDKQKHDELRYNVLEIRLYLRTDFPLHLKFESIIPEHCLFYALSDPNEPDFRKVESHEHEIQCPRCNLMYTTSRELEGLMKGAVDKASVHHKHELRELQFRVKSNTESIWMLRDHEIRSKFSDLEDAGIKSNLKEGEGRLLVDFGQKWEPMWHMEPQEDYFAKAGQTMHFSHLLTKIGGEYVSHTFVHLLDTATQDSKVVVAILEHVLTESKKVGVNTFHIRSDNGGPYHSSMTLGSVQWLAEHTSTEILSWSFSAAQHGKSDCDRMSGVCKTKMRSHCHAGHDVRTLREMYDALVSGQQLRGVSVHLASVKKPMEMPDEAKLSKISDYGHFEFKDDTIRVWKYHNVGEGRIVENLHPVKVDLLIHAEDGHLASLARSDFDKYLVKSRQESEFWLNDFNKKDEDVEYEDRDDDAATDQPTGPSNPRDSIHHCWCGAGFIRYQSLINHLESGTHRVIPEKIDIIDYSIGTFKKAIEGILNLSPLLPLKDIAESIFDRSIPTPDEGFAMRKKRKGGRLAAEPRKFVVDYYEHAMREGKRPDANEALRLLTAVDSIPPEIRLTFEQIKSLFSRLSKTTTVSRARRYSTEDEDEDGEWDQEYDEMDECQLDISRTYYDFVMTNRDTLFPTA